MNKQDKAMRKAWEKQADKLAGRDIDKLISDFKVLQSKLIHLNKIIFRQKIILIILLMGVLFLLPWVVL